MGMIVTLYLISANVYNAVEAPPTRGFSYIEVWMLGTQAPILLALSEYGFILLLKKVAKKITTKENQAQDINHKNLTPCCTIFHSYSVLKSQRTFTTLNKPRTQLCQVKLHFLGRQ